MKNPLICGDLSNFAHNMKQIAHKIALMLLLSTIGASAVWTEESLPPRLQQMVDEAYRAYSARETDKFFERIDEAENANKEQFGDERLQALLKRDLGDAQATSETIHRAVEDFVGDAEPSDDLTKMCIKVK